MKAVTMKKKRALGLLLVMVLLLCGSLGTALASSDAHGEAAAPKSWGADEWFRTMNFTAFCSYALFLLLRKPAAQVFSDRIKGIKEQLDDLEAQKAAAEKKLGEYNAKLAELEGEAASIMESYIAQGNEAKARIIEEAKSMADKLEDQAKKNIENEFQRAKETLQAEVVEAALEKAEEIIKERISDDDQDKSC
jgi:F-type H+-transporting ATPase subunit b